MKCIFCGQRDVDGALDQCGQYVCVDCWADGTAGTSGHVAESFVGARGFPGVSYPPDLRQRFLDSCNHKEPR